MKALLLYQDDERNISSDRFLPKSKLRELFGTDKEISLIITYTKRHFRVNHSKEGRCHEKAMSPTHRQKSRVIYL